MIASRLSSAVPLLAAATLAVGPAPAWSGGAELAISLAPSFDGHEAIANAPDVRLVEHDDDSFGSDPTYGDRTYDSQAQLDIYGDKHLNRTQRPWMEVGRRFYDRGPIPPAPFGRLKNPGRPSFLMYGDLRTAAAVNDVGAEENGVWAARLNLELDLTLTATERFHASIRPLDSDGRFTRYEFMSKTGKEDGFDGVLDGEPDALFFEGDWGAIIGGTDSRIDLPFAVGLIPLVFQDGIWLDDSFAGLAFAFPAKNSRTADISNADVTFYVGLDKVTSPVFAGDDHAAHVYGMNAFIEAHESYFEVGYAFVDDRDDLGRSFHGIAWSMKRRYGRTLSNSVRLMANVDQSPLSGERTADGWLLLVENSFITRRPSTVVPYFNVFAGSGTPQSIARGAGTGGILKNTGILFESDGLTDYPTLDATGFDTWGGAVGIELLGRAFEHQIVVEAATVQLLGGDSVTTRTARGEQYGLAVRYQRPLNHALIFRADAMVGQRREEEDVSGLRVELRYKF